MERVKLYHVLTVFVAFLELSPCLSVVMCGAAHVSVLCLCFLDYEFMGDLDGHCCL